MSKSLTYFTVTKRFHMLNIVQYYCFTSNINHGKVFKCANRSSVTNIFSVRFVGMCKLICSKCKIDYDMDIQCYSLKIKGYNLQIIEVKNCVDGPVLHFDENFTANLTEDCEVIAVGCIKSLGFATAKVIWILNVWFWFSF